MPNEINRESILRLVEEKKKSKANYYERGQEYGYSWSMRVSYKELSAAVSTEWIPERLGILFEYDEYPSVLEDILGSRELTQRWLDGFEQAIREIHREIEAEYKRQEREDLKQSYGL